MCVQKSKFTLWRSCVRKSMFTLWRSYKRKSKFTLWRSCKLKSKFTLWRSCKRKSKKFTLWRSCKLGSKFTLWTATQVFLNTTLKQGSGETYFQDNSKQIFAKHLMPGHKDLRLLSLQGVDYGPGDRVKIS